MLMGLLIESKLSQQSTSSLVLELDIDMNILLSRSGSIIQQYPLFACKKGYSRIIDPLHACTPTCVHLHSGVQAHLHTHMQARVSKLTLLPAADRAGTSAHACWAPASRHPHACALAPTLACPHMMSVCGILIILRKLRISILTHTLIMCGRTSAPKHPSQQAG